MTAFANQLAAYPKKITLRDGRAVLLILSEK